MPLSLANAQINNINKATTITEKLTIAPTKTPEVEDDTIVAFDEADWDRVRLID